MQNAKSIIFFFPEILIRGTPSRAANRSRAKQPAVVSRSPIPAPNSRAVPIVSCAVRRSRSQYRSPVPLVSVHCTSSTSVGHPFVVVQVRPLAPVPISTRSCSPSVSGRRHQFVVKAGRRHQSSWRRRTRDASPIARSGGGAKGNRAKGRKKPARWNRESRDLYLHSRTPLAYMPSFPLQMHSYVKCKVQIHNDWRDFFWSFIHFGKCQVHLHNGWSCSKQPLNKYTGVAAKSLWPSLCKKRIFNFHIQ